MLHARNVGLLSIAAALSIALMPVRGVSQVGPNDVALGKTASQWADYPGYTAGSAIDGSTSGLATTSITLAGNPFGWWMVDLGGDFDITSIVLWNRGDGCCPYRLNDVFISILASGTSTPTSELAPTVFTEHVTTAVGVSQTFTPAAGVFGRYVKVQYDGAPPVESYLS